MIKLCRILVLLGVMAMSFTFWVSASMTLKLSDQMMDGSSRLVFVIIEMFKIMLGG